MATFNAGSIEATLDLDRSPFSRGIELARAEGRRFAAERFNAQLTIDAAAVEAKIAALEAQLNRLDGRRVEPNIDVDTAGVMAQLLALQLQLDRIDGRNVSPDMRGGTQEMTAFASATASAGGGMGAMIPLALALGPALIPGIAGATAALGGLVSMLSAAGGGLGLLAGGLIGNIMRVSKAQKDLTTAQDQSTAAAAANEAAQQRVASALQGVGDAERGLANARRNAAYATGQAEEGLAAARRNAVTTVQAAEQGLADARQSAARSVAGAEAQVEQAQDNVRRAQEALNQARADAVQRLADMRDQLRGAALDEEGSELAVREAKLRLDAAMADPAATMLSRQEAQLAYDRALYQMDQARKKNDDLQDSVAAAQKAGVEGDSQVVAAKDRLQSAKEAEASAETKLAQARADAANTVARAEGALAKAKADAARQVANAEKNLAKTRADGARSIADAQRGLARAREQVAQAEKGAAVTAAALAAANKAQADAMSKLTGPAADYVEAMKGAKDAWNDFLDATEADTLGLATKALGLFSKYLPDLVPVVHAVTPVITELMDEFDRWAEKGGMDGFVDFLVKYAPPAIEGFGHIVGNLLDLIGNLNKAFAPYGLEILDWFEKITGAWADSTEDLGKKPGFQHFMDYVHEYGGKFIDFMDAAWDALINIGKALAPSAGPVLDALTKGLRFIADMDPTQLGLIAGGVEAIVGAVLLLLSDGMNPAGWILLFAGINTGLTSLGASGAGADTDLGKLRDTMKDLHEWLGEKWDTMWNKTLKPNFEDIKDTLNNDVLPAWEGWWDVIKPLVKFFGETWVGVLTQGMGDGLRAIDGGLKLISGVLEVWTGVMTLDFDKFKQGIATSAEGLGLSISNPLKRAFLFTIPGLMLQGAAKIAGGWGPLKRAFAEPINWIIEHVINNFIAGVNAISRKLGKGDILSPLGTISLAGTYSSAAAGGGSAAVNNNDRRTGGTGSSDLANTRGDKGAIHTGAGGAGFVASPISTRGVTASSDPGSGGRGGSGSGVFWPVPGHDISTYANHDGVDINRGAGWDDYGDPIRAFRSGTITYVGAGHGYGDAIFEQVDGGPTVVYGHTSGQNVRAGQRVAAGQLIGQVGSTGHSSAPHLHFGIPGGTYAQALALLNGASGGGFAGLGKLAGSVVSQLNPAKLASGLVSRVAGVAGSAAGGPFGSAMAQGASSTIGNMVTAWAASQAGKLGVLTPIGAAGRAVTQLFDQGGVVEPGLTHVVNASGKPEALLNREQWMLARNAFGVDAPAGSKDGWTREDIERLIDAVAEANPVILPPGESTRDEWDRLGFELRTQGRGGK